MGSKQHTISIYDNSESAQFMKVIIGDDSAHVHYGVFNSPDDSLADAAQNTVDTMLTLATNSGATINASSKVLDAGSGNGGAAHHLVSKTGCHVTCLNLCAGQNAVNEEKVNKLGISDHVDVHTGSFEACPDSWSSRFDVVWSADAVLHSSNKSQVFSEFMRVLKPGGYLVISDILARSEATEESRAIFKERLHVDEFCTPEEYKATMSKAGFEILRERDLTGYLLRNYQLFTERLITERHRLSACSDEFVKSYATIWQRYVDALTQGPSNCWWVYTAKKQEAAEH